MKSVQDFTSCSHRFSLPLAILSLDFYPIYIQSTLSFHSSRSHTLRFLLNGFSHSDVLLYFTGASLSLVRIQYTVESDFVIVVILFSMKGEKEERNVFRTMGRHVSQ
ncbi:CLUMA_CG019175, isoform A [Clunio marinus]|uniref:CLUMA_CG019175, isoform A n=1 Tax=Clunio marinus TaxID=568069 RepID=A0A1J1J3J3_9DIPT|nr:CLUMA_CG019175, isoform A [Clunio marinus]